MDERIATMIKGLDLRPPSSVVAIDKFERNANFKLPDDYIEFLRFTNGGEGFIGEQSYIMLWPIQDMIELNKSYKVNEYASGLFLFGSNGGGEAYAFDISSKHMNIVQVPFVGMDLSLVQSISSTFNGFVAYLYGLKKNE